MRSNFQLASPIKIPGLMIFLAGLLALVTAAHAEPSVPYMPSWQARHQLELLVDEAGLQITTTHWPLPAAAVQDALDDLPGDLPPALAEARAFVNAELGRLRQHGQADVQLRNRAEAPVGFGENYTPGSSIRLSSAAEKFGPDGVPLAARIGVRVEQNPDSLQTNFSGGLGKNSRTQARLDDTALVADISGFNVQAFAHQNWWGPGWQSSLINSNNIPPWMGVGIQRSAVKPSESKWLSWMGAWSFEGFIAQAQDPAMVANQPNAYFMGSRLTLKPWSWAEIGLTRDEQMNGSAHDMLSTTFGVGNTQGAQQDVYGASNGVAGYDVRLSCPKGVHCSTWFQWMGEDASGQSHLPNQFMTLGGVDWWSASGRHRLFTEFMQTYTHSLPWNDYHYVGSGYRNGSFPQGFTNGGRWIGSSFGGDARILTVGWLDAQASRTLKVYSGETSTALGSYDPNTNATGNLIGPHGRLTGFSAQQSFQWNAWAITPELAYTHLAEGISIGFNKTTNLRGGVTLSRPLGD